MKGEEALLCVILEMADVESPNSRAPLLMTFSFFSPTAALSIT
jgi:hypothetical protein